MMMLIIASIAVKSFNLHILFSRIMSPESQVQVSATL
jgi:hypothetical protein